MYIRFVIDPFVPHGTNKIIRRVIQDLRKILHDVTYSIESDESLGALSQRRAVPTTKIFQKKITLNCKGVTVYILNADLIWHGRRVYGISLPDKCAIGIQQIQRSIYKTWAAKIWDLILHELGHSFGLIQKNRTRLVVVEEHGTKHCLNHCVMSEDKHDFIWSKKARSRFSNGTPFCEDCLKYLISKDV